MSHPPRDTNAEAAWREQLATAQHTPWLAGLTRGDSALLKQRFMLAYRQVQALPRRARRLLRRKLAPTLAGVALVLALSNVPAARAAGISVGGSCTLVDAITAANTDTATGGCAAGSGADTITLSGNVTLTSGSPSVIIGGSNGLPLINSVITIEGNGFSIARDASAPNFRILQVVGGGNLTLNNTTITGGHTAFGESAGGILNTGGTLALNNSTVSGNSAGADAGGIFNYGTLTLNNSTVSGNIASIDGGGIANFGTLTLDNSTASGNTGGRWGGGIFNGATRTVTLSNSTLSGNTAPSGGGVYNKGTLTLASSLISGNTASNTSEILNYSYCYYSCYSGTVNAANFNLIGHDGDAGSANFSPSGSDIVPSYPLAAIIGPLANNGGPTLTHALVTGSPAVDAAPTGPATDQRGVARPQGPAFDIGAFELEQGAIDATTPTIAITTPADGAVYTLGQALNASYACQDEAGGSGLASCVGTAPNGSAIDTASVGAKSFTVNAADNAGNASALTHNYSVVYAFSGFFSPVDNLPTLNEVKAGRSIPVKFSLGGNQGLNIIAAGYPVSQQVACNGNLPVDVIEQTTTANQGLTYDAASGQYNYVWKTQSSWAGTCRQFTLRLTDGTEHVALFKFK